MKMSRLDDWELDRWDDKRSLTRMMMVSGIFDVQKENESMRGSRETIGFVGSEE